MALLNSSIETMPNLPLVCGNPACASCRRYLIECTCPLNCRTVLFVHTDSMAGLSRCSLSIRYRASVDLPLPFFPSIA